MSVTRNALLLLMIVMLIGCSNDSSPTSPSSQALIGSISVSADPEMLDQSNPQAHSTITMTCLDHSGNPVPAGQKVSITTTLGFIARSAVTGANGIATATLLAGGATGKAEIAVAGDGPEGPIKGGAHVDLVDPSVLVSFEVTSAPKEISVKGVGGVETSIVTVRALNGLGEPVTDELQVTATLLQEPDPPEGCILDGSAGPAETTTAEGVVRFGLNAGIRSHTPVIRISAGNVEAVVSPAVVVGGPAHGISVGIDNWGWDVGGGSWAVEVSANVRDVHMNPVPDGTPVSFSVDPQNAMVSGATTGNKNRNGVSSSGVAVAKLVYQSARTFDPITISASVATQDGLLSDVLETQLPLQKGYLSIHCDPNNWMFDRARPNDTCQIRVWVVVKDGHDYEVNNAPVLFGTDKARFFWRNLRTNRFIPFADPVRRMTGLVNQENNEPPGTATVYLRGPMADFFLDDFTLTTKVNITAELEGFSYISAAPQEIVFNRH